MNGPRRVEVGAGRHKEPIHLLAIRLPVYAGVALLGVGPIAPGAGLVAVLVGLVAGLWAGRELASSSVRGPVIAAAAMAVVALGLMADRMIGGPSWVASLLGYRAALAAGEALTFGLIAMGLVAGTRALAARRPVCGVAEIALAAMVVVGAFAGHRDAHLSRPQFLSDWALSHGYDPIQVLVAIGLSGALGCALLLLRPQRPLRTAASMLTLVGVTLLFLLLLGHYLPEYRTMPRDEPGDEPTAASPPPPKPEDQPNPKPQDRPNPETPPRPQTPRPNPEPQPKPEPGPESNGEPPRPDQPPSFVAIVNLLDDLNGAADLLYFRQQAESRLVGARLVEAELPADDDVPRRPPAGRSEFPVAPLDARVHAEVAQRISMLTDRERPLGLIGPRSIEPKPVADPKAFKCTYHVTSRVLTVPLSRLIDRKAGNPSWSAATRDCYLGVPADPRYRTLAERVVAESINDAKLKPAYRNSPALRAMALLRWVEEHTIYSKHPKPSSDPTAAFLFDGRPGKCTEVAHAMVFLLRSLHIPARAASGYMAPASRLGTGSYLLLQDTDAHQWCEVYFEGVGWVAVDTFPGRRLTPPDPEPDPVTQARYGEMNREPESAVVDRLKADERPGQSGPSWSATATVALALMLCLYGVKVWRWLAPRWASGPALGRVGYRAALDRLAEVGLARRFGETRAEFAERVAGLVPVFVTLTEAHDRGALTGQAVFDPDALRAFGSRFAAGFPRRRRLLGLIDPLSWLKAR